ncbi:hypothetical protein [Herbidospora sp. NBRC 101105]|uniref:hypothetical protein n=1 Tax=Herbidospora sp. NBRC 101105 TaxID=3032195 RepID=UPI0024A2D3D5|nr:hypothetical protein [Herbidospora sp. NBRC 101105]GLX95235.1 hypothetical protein Hesp01_31850 [Herbidospora sp. NBRC 101105]
MADEPRSAWHDCCVIEKGLTDAEFARIEHEYGLEFAAGLPSTGSETGHRLYLGKTMAGLAQRRPPPTPRLADFLLHDVRHGHWHSAWGERPDSGDAVVDLARSHLAGTPRMVPVYAHRFLPAGHGTFGHPVLSMWGIDIIYYGVDLRPEHPEDRAPRATVPFCRDYL